MNVLLYISCFSLMFFSCSQELKKNEVSSDVEEALKKGSLIVLTNNSPYSYFEYREELLGFEYEILSAFSKKTGIPLEYKVVNSEENQLAYLKEKRGDIVASNIALNMADKDIAFSTSYDRSKMVLVRRKSSEKFNLDSLNNKTIVVPSNSNLLTQLKAFKTQTSANFIIETMEDINAEDLIEKVENREIDFTVANDNLIFLKEFDSDKIDFNIELSFPQKIGFAMRHNCHELKNKIDSFLVEFVSSDQYKKLEKKYFEFEYLNPPLKFSPNKKNLTPFDDIFKKTVKNTGWDWRLIAALIQKESNFNPQALGMGGSFGVAQLMPFIGEKYGVDINSSIEQQLQVAVMILNKHIENWNGIPDVTERTKFALASYNAGLGHIIDAQNLAEELGLNPLRWDSNVEVALIKLHTSQFYKKPFVKCGAYFGHADYYVRRIFEIYNGYKEL